MTVHRRTSRGWQPQALRAWGWLAGAPAGARSSPAPRKRIRPGLTLAELMVAMATMLIVILALGTVIVDGIRGWQRTYARVYADVKTDGYVARNVFDRVVRSAGRQTLAADGAWLEVYYYLYPSSTWLDRYARFIVANGQLQIQHGNRALDGTLSGPDTTETVCGNVVVPPSGRIFNADGRSAQMELTLDDGSQSATVVSSAVMHNGS